MPQAINLVLKNAAATNKTFELIAPASGDGGVAQWALKEGTVSSVFPIVTAMAKATTNNSRQLRLKLRLPSSFTDTVTGRTLVSSGAEMNITVSIPGDYPESLKPDFAAFCKELLANALVNAMLKDAYPAT